MQVILKVVKFLKERNKFLNKQYLNNEIY